MSMRRRVPPAGGPRRAGAAGAALVLAGAGVVLALAAGPAQAAEVSFPTRCVPPAGVGLDPVDGTTKVEITAPAGAKVGDEIDVVWKFTQAASKNPNIIDLPANSVQPTGTLKAAGAQSADIAMTGPRENPAIPKGGDMVLSDMKGTLKLTAAGQLTLTPGAYTVNAMGTNTVCTPTGTVPTAATLTVAAGDGTSTPTPDPTDTPTPTPTPTPTDTESPDPTPSSTESEGDGQTDFTGKAVAIPYTCQSPLGEKKATSEIQINAKKDGGSYGITVQFKNSPMDSPADIPADSVKPSMDVLLGGDDTGSVHVEGPTNSAAIKSGDPIEIPDMTGTYKPGATGESTLSPGVLTIEALGTTTTCKPDRTEVSLTLTTQEQEGGASGGSSSSGGTSTSGSSTSGGLAATGADDHAALKALGLVAGTALLLGGAIFTFLPGRKRL
ncbi:hypothetical protein M2164_005082 [Streptomyces sp. SAI-208]|nr:hypothetical protein [Streptomyces sp. SAI-133]MDH6609447.1 hypothetical protein [Streptomyces sp. SAI-208]